MNVKKMVLCIHAVDEKCTRLLYNKSEKGAPGKLPSLLGARGSQTLTILSCLMTFSIRVFAGSLWFFSLLNFFPSFLL